jgi:hypothetical protein
MLVGEAFEELVLGVVFTFAVGTSSVAVGVVCLRSHCEVHVGVVGDKLFWQRLRHGGLFS